MGHRMKRWGTEPIKRNSNKQNLASIKEANPVPKIGSVPQKPKFEDTTPKQAEPEGITHVRSKPEDIQLKDDAPPLSENKPDIAPEVKKADSVSQKSDRNMTSTKDGIS